MFKISLIILWIIVIFLSYAVLTMLRYGTKRKVIPQQLIHTDKGLPTNSIIPELKLVSINNNEVLNENVSKFGKLLIFTSVSCKACENLYPEIEMFMKSHPQTHISIIMNGEIEQVKEKIPNLLDYVYILPWETIHSVFKIEVFPFAYSISSQGLIVGKGLVNNRTHLEILISMQKNE